MENGAALINGGRVAWVGRWPDVPESFQRVFDLGDAVLLPGLVNAHCHLDYTDMAGRLPPPKLFPDWIKGLLAFKAHWSYTDYSASWLRGAKMLLRGGVTTVADIEAVPELLPDVWNSTPLRVCSFLEMTGVRAQRDPGEILQEAIDRIGNLAVNDRHTVGLSPHAPYSTTPELLRLTAAYASDHPVLVSTHLAESQEEFDMFAHGTGPMYDWLKHERDVTDCRKGTPVQHLERAGLLSSSLIATHVNYIGEEDAALLARKRVSVVHCPRSFAYFAHRQFPFERLRHAGVHICLGTDSMASVRKAGSQPLELNLFAEMQQFALSHSGIRPEQMLEMVTTAPARALKLAGAAGEISPGSDADLIGINYAGALEGAFEAVVHNTAPVSYSMIDGNWQVFESSDQVPVM